MGKYVRKFEKLSDSRRGELIAQITKLMKQGKSNKLIVSQLLRETKGKSSENMILSLLKEAALNIKNEYVSDINTIKAIHTLRYDKIINENLNVQELDPANIVPEGGELIVDSAGNISQKEGITYRQWEASRKRKIRAYDALLDTMEQKENLLQLVNMDLQIDLNEEIDINVTENNKSYDLSKLTFEEKVEFMNLLQKARKNRIEPEGVIESEITKDVQVTEDIEAEVLPANVELIKQVTPTDSNLNDQPVTDPTQKLREALAKLAAKKFKEAGFKLNEDEKKLLD